MDQLLTAWPLPLVFLAFGLSLLGALLLLAPGTSLLSRSILLITAAFQLTAGIAILWLPEWTSRHIPLGRILLTLQLDQAAGVWLTLCGGMLGILTLSGTLDLPRHRQILLLLAIGCVAAAACQDDFLWLLMLVSCCGWLCIAALAEDISASQFSPGGRWQDLPVWCGLFVVADLAAIGGLKLLLASLPHLSLTQLQASHVWARMAEREPAMLSSAATLLWGMLVIRLGIYPAISWLKAASRTTTATLVLITLIWPANLLIWFRLLPMLQLAPETRLMVAGLSAFSLVLLGFLACFLPAEDVSETDRQQATHQHHRRCLLYIAAGFNAIVCLGPIAAGTLEPNVFMVAALAACVGPALFMLLLEFPNMRLLAVLAGGGMSAAVPGFGWCLDTAFHPSQLPALANSLGWLTGLGQLLLWCGLLRVVSQIYHVHRSTARFFAATFAAGLIGGLIAGICFPQRWGFGADPNMLLAAWAIPAFVLAVAAVRLHLITPVETTRRNSLTRLAEQEFYLNDILEQAIAYPMWCLQLVMTYLADGLFLRGLPFATKAMESSTGEALEELDAPAMRTMHWEVVLMTTLALGLAVWVMG